MGNEFKLQTEDKQNNFDLNHGVPLQSFVNLCQYSPQVEKHLAKHKPHEKQLEGIKGYPIKTFNGSEFYQGPLNKEEKPDGFGKLVRKDGSLLLATFEDGNASGQCYYIFADGSWYIGSMKNNQAKGKGQLTKDNFFYQGQFAHNVFNGLGKLTIGKVFSFEGKFQDGKKKSGKLRWLENEKDTQLSQYEGSFNEGQEFEGKGILKNKYGIYEGMFKGGKKDGKGEFKYRIGIVYEGEYTDDLKHGQGALYNMQKVDGKPTYAKKDQLISYRGGFKNGMPHGVGSVWNKAEGKFEKSQYVEGLNKSNL